MRIQTSDVVDISVAVVRVLTEVSTIDCNQTPSWTTPTATDLCDANPTLTFNDVTTAGNCPGNYSITRTWTATDACGNTSTRTQTINVQDVTPPVISALPSVCSIDCKHIPSFTPPTANIFISASPTLTFNDVTTA